MIYLYTDGACHVKTGVGGFAYVIVYNNKFKKYSQKAINTTNNRMELLAVIEGLIYIYNDELLTKEKNIKVLSDSQYIVNAINKNWLLKWSKENFVNRLNADLWRRLLKVLKEFTNAQIEFVWIRGHSGNHFNELCDKLAVAASNS